MEWEKFFEQMDEYELKAIFYECSRNFTVEDLYQAFKARMLAEANPELGD